MTAASKSTNGPDSEDKIRDNDSEISNSQTDDNDQLDEECQVFRNLFRTSSSSSSSLASSFEGCNDNQDAATTTAQQQLDGKNREEIRCHGNDDDDECKIKNNINSFMGNIRLDQNLEGGIADRLWPAASYLAEFVLESASKVIGEITYNNDDIDGRCDTLIENDIKDKTSFCDETSGYHNDHKRKQKVKESITSLYSFLRDSPLAQRSKSSQAPLRIIELGAGVGLTGIKIATELPARVVLTELPCALDRLMTNITLNEDLFCLGVDAVAVRQLEWGTDDALSVLHDEFLQCHHLVHSTGEQHKVEDERDGENNSNTPPPPPPPKILLLASDCVYFRELHLPLEKTLATILSTAPEGSLCLIAGCRRWKRDNAFYANLGKKTRTRTHTLSCVCVRDVVKRKREERGEANGADDDDDETKREIMRVFCVRWLPR